MDYNAVAREALDPIHRVGKVSKIYGVNGEVLVRLTGDLGARDVIDLTQDEPLWIEIDSIATPFFVKSAKSQGTGSMVVTFDHIDSEQKANIIIGRDAFLLSAEKERQKAGDWPDMEGYKFLDLTSGHKGVVLEIIENSLNPLLLIERENGEECYVPLAEELIESVSKRQRTIKMRLAEGIF